MCNNQVFAHFVVAIAITISFVLIIALKVQANEKVVIDTGKESEAEIKKLEKFNWTKALMGRLTNPFFGKDNCIKGSTDKLSWSAAQEYCRAHFSDLLSIESEKEWKYLYQQLHGPEKFFTSLTDVRNESQWVWQSSCMPLRKSDFQVWNPVTPNNPTKNCMVASITEKAEESKWEPVPCDTPHKFICEDQRFKCEQRFTPRYNWPASRSKRALPDLDMSKYQLEVQDDDEGSAGGSARQQAPGGASVDWACYTMSPLGFYSTYRDAGDFCKMGQFGQLTMIAGQKELNRLISWIQRMRAKQGGVGGRQPKREEFWVGATYHGTGDLHWDITCDPFPYTNWWNPPQLNNLASNRHCVYLQWDTDSKNVGMRTAECWQNHRWICKNKSAKCSDTGGAPRVDPGGQPTPVIDPVPQPATKPTPVIDPVPQTKTTPAPNPNPNKNKQSVEEWKRNLKKTLGDGRGSTRMAGGTPATPGEFPFLVSIQRYVKNSPPEILNTCGGALLGERYVLTAAHCFDDEKDLSMYEVVVGVQNVTDLTEASQMRYKIHKITTHSEYKGFLKGGWGDLAMIQLISNVTLGPGVSFGNLLPLQEDILNHTCEVMGWGFTEPSGNTPAILQKATQTILNVTKCVEALMPLEILDDGSVQCADGTMGPCYLDGGAPLVCWNAMATPMVKYVSGIASLTGKCGDSKVPNPYAFLGVNFHHSFVTDVLTNGLDDRLPPS